MLAIALAVMAAIVLVALRWHALVPAPTPELPSSQPKAARRPSPVAAQLAYRAEEGEAEPPDWEVTGIVLDEQGLPVPGASLAVDLMCWHGDEVDPPTRTDAEGRFALELLPDCTMWLYASHDGQSARVLVGGLQGESITVQLLRDNDVIIHVVDAISHAPVRGVHATASQMPPCDHAVCADATGDDRGTVRLQRPHAALVAAPGYADNVLYFERAWRLPEEGPLPIEQTVELRPLHRVVGTVLDAEGTPLAGARVYMNFPGETVTDELGRFEIEVPAGTWISATKQCAHHRSLQAGGVTENGMPMVLKVQPGSGTCEPPPPQGPPPPSPPSPQPPPPPEVDVLVTVIDESGRIVPKADIRSFTNGMRPGRTDASGRYAFRTRGVSDLYARRGERMSPLASVGGEQREVTVQIQPAAITGKVIDSDGKAVSRAWVRVRFPRRDAWGSSTRDLLTDVDGHFGLVVPPGRYLISAFDNIEGFDYDGPNATVIATDTRDVTFEIP